MAVNGLAIVLLSIPCVLGFNLWSGFQPLGPGSSVLDLEDFIVSNNLLPLGSLAFVLFCTKRTAGAGRTSWRKPTTGKAGTCRPPSGTICCMCCPC